MRKMLLGVAVAAMTLTGFAASAQPGAYGRGGYDSDRDGRSDRREWNRDRDRDGRPDQYDRYDNRRHHRGWDRDHDRYDRYDRYGRGGYGDRW